MPQNHVTINIDDPAELPPNDPDHRISVKNQDTVTWESANDFRILDIRLELPPPPPLDSEKPVFPFSGNLPFDARSGTDNTNIRKYRVNSGPAVSGSAGETYKVKFKRKSGPLNDQVIDPHIIIVP